MLVLHHTKTRRQTATQGRRIHPTCPLALSHPPASPRICKVNNNYLRSIRHSTLQVSVAVVTLKKSLVEAASTAAYTRAWTNWPSMRHHPTPVLMLRKPPLFLVCNENAVFRRMVVIGDRGTQAGQYHRLVIGAASQDSPQAGLHHRSWRTLDPISTTLLNLQRAVLTPFQIQMFGQSARVPSTHGAAALQNHSQVVSTPLTPGYPQDSKVKTLQYVAGRTRLILFGRATRCKHSPPQAAEQACPRSRGGG